MDGDAYVQALAKWIQREGKRLAERNPNPPISISLHHLYYLLTRIDDLEVPIGPLNIRLEDLNGEHQNTSSSSSNYVSFRKKNSDAASIRSVSSIRSVMSTVGSSMWSGFGMFGSGARTDEQIAEDLKQLYSAFCKIPTIRLAPNKSLQLVSGFEEYPFDTAVPLLSFKNLQFLEISGYTPKQFYGWSELSEQLRSLVMRRCGLTDLEVLTIGVIKEELERKRRKAERGTRHWQTISDNGPSVPSSPRPSTQSSYFTQQQRSQTGAETGDRPRSASPNLTVTRPGAPNRKLSRFDRQQSSMSVSETIPKFILPNSKWRFLRYLSLADNGIKAISVDALAPLASNLNFLDLSKNQFTVIPAALATLSALRSLDMANNQIESLHCLLQSPLPGISTLNLRSNKLHTIAGIDRLPSLERVDLRDNLLKDPMEMARLNGAPNFSEMWTAGNPFTRTHYDYRTAIFNIFRSNPNMTDDISLDGKKPGMLEKRNLEPRALEQAPLPKALPPPTNTAPSTAPASPAVRTDIRSESTVETSQEEHNVKPKKKSHKSRLIDLSAPAESNKPTSPTRSPEAKTPSKALSQGTTRSESTERASGEEYRKKIEALKEEVGSGWIRVINEESFKHKQAVSPG